MFYRAYGLLIRSDFDLSPLGVECIAPPLTESIGLRISLDTDDSQSLAFVDNQTCVDVFSGYYFRENIALYRFFSGKEIKVLVLAETIDLDFLRVLMNYPIACVMFQRGFLTLHASAVSFHDKVLMFCGQSLSGKSSIAAKFLKYGAKLVTEDSAILKIDRGKVRIMPSYPFIKISSKVNEYIGFCHQNGLELPADKNQRLGYKLNKDQFLSKPIQVDYCFYLDWSEDKAKIEKEDFKNQYKRILQASLNIYPLSREKEKLIFSSTLKFLKNVKTFRYMRQKKLTSLKNVIEHVESINFPKSF